MTPIKKCKVCGKPFSGEGEVGPTCAEHAGLVGRYYVIESGAMDPDQFIYLKELCDLAEDYGRSRHWMVKLTGGDAGVNPPHSPEFTITFSTEGNAAGVKPLPPCGNWRSKNHDPL